MEPLDLSELEGLAQAAIDDDDAMFELEVDGPPHLIAYVEAISPEVTLQLISEIRRLRKEVSTWRVEHLKTQGQNEDQDEEAG